MELTDLFNEHDWDSPSDKMDKEEISRAMRSGVETNVRILYSTYHRSIYLNLFFLTGILSVYGFNPSLEVLIPVLLIGCCFLFIIINVAGQLIDLEPVDTSLDLRSVIESTLAFNTKVYEKQCRYNSFILNSSFVGGFLLGLALQGWTFEKFQQKPIIFLVTAVLGIMFYFFTRSSYFKAINKALNPRFHGAKRYLEEQLNNLKEND